MAANNDKAMFTERPMSSFAAAGRFGFDVFLAHASRDRDLVVCLATQLRGRQVRPWVDVEQVRPGVPFQDAIQSAIAGSAMAAVIIGRRGLGRWQALEVRALVCRFVEAGRPVIPVLLPGVRKIPPSLLFLREFGYVAFVTTLDEPAALDRLVWGITGAGVSHVRS